VFIVSLTYKTELFEVDKHIDAHIDYLEKYYASGKFVVSGRKIPRTGGIILVNAKNKDELNQILADDPFYQADVANYEITEFLPTMAAEEFETLIA